MVSSANLPLQVTTLGKLQIKYQAREISFRMSKALGLLIYLMCEPGQDHGRDRLATYLWPEESESKARENFRQALYQIRRPFGKAAEQYFDVDRKTVQFIADAPHWLDVTQFETAVAEQEWLTAVDLYQGVFLTDFHLDDTLFLSDWLQRRRERLERGVVQALSALARGAYQRADWDETEQYAHDLLKIRPEHEATHRLLMRLYAQRRQRSESLAQYERCTAVLAAELGVEPGAKTQMLYEQIKIGVWPVPVSPQEPRKHNLPLSLTPLVGRRTELKQVQSLIHRPECRLLTIFGPGGIGKTRLLQAIGWALHESEQAADGLFFISLLNVPPQIDEGEALVEEIARLILQELVTTLPDNKNETWTALLIEQLHGREVVLLLDNWETYLSGVGVLTRLLTAVAQLKVINTSREPLRVQGEWLFELHGLSRPPIADTAVSRAHEQEQNKASFEAVDLFMQAARRQQSHFDPTPAEQAHIVTICQALEGHPLALELAAGWLHGLTPAELMSGVTEGLDLLMSNAPTIAPRHQNMRHLLAYSWSRLPPYQQRTLAQLSLFRRPFTLKMGTAVAEVNAIKLAELVQQTWLRRLRDGRYEYHELLRHFAAEQLQANPDLHQAARIRYVRHLLTSLAERHDAWQKEPHPEQVVALRRHWADMEQAWWAAIEYGLWVELGNSVRMFVLYHNRTGLFATGIKALAETSRKIRAMPGQTDQIKQTLAQLLFAEAYNRNLQGTSETVPALMAEAAPLAQACGDVPLWVEIQAAWVLGLARLGRFTEAQTIGERALAELPSDTDPAILAPLWGSLGNNFMDWGQLIQAEKYDRKKLLFDEAQGLTHQAISSRHNLAICLSHLGQYDEARQLFRKNMAILRPHPNYSYMGMAREGLGYLYLQQDNLTWALLHLRAAWRIYKQIDDLDGLAYAHLYLGQVMGVQEIWPQAETHYRKALRLRQELKHPHLLTQCWVGLAEAACGQEHWSAAQAHLQQCWETLEAGAVTGEDVTRTYWGAYHVCVALNWPERAGVVLAQGVAYVREQAALLADDPAAQETFLWEIGTHRALLTAAGEQPLSPPI